MAAKLMKSDNSPSNSKQTIRGFLISRQWQETAQGIQLVFWAATDSGPLRFSITDQESVFFIPEDSQEKATNLLRRYSRWRWATTKLKSFTHEPIIALYFKSQRRLYDSKDLLLSNGIKVFEADINPTDRFLMERFITGGFKTESLVATRQGYLEATNPLLQAIDYRPVLSCVSIDIETAYSSNALYSIGLVTHQESIVFMVGDENPALDSEPLLTLCADEKSVIVAFLNWIEQFDPDIIIGWNVVNFDLRFLQQCCERLNIDFRLGRDQEQVKWRKSRDSNDRYFALVPGRVVLDGIELMRSATYQFENFSLDYVAKKLLNRGKLVEDVDQRGEEISRLFSENKKALAEYNIEDCRLVWEIFEQEQLLSFAVERSQLTGLALSRYGGSVAAFDFLYLPKLHRAGFVAPSLDHENVVNMSPGGYVMNSIPGIYDHVIVLDFKSLYPSIIRTFHVDPLALVVGETESDSIVGFDGAVFSRHSTILPKLIENLWQARDRAKASGNSVLSQAIKIIMNSFYGVLGTTGCRFFDPRLVSSITKRGHQLMIESKDFIEKSGYKVIYGDTDSVFVLLGNQRDATVDEIGHGLAKQLNIWWSDRLKSEMGVDSCLEIEFEIHYQKFLMPTIRGTETGSKKRYAGLVRTGSGEKEYRLIFKGLETVRSDWSPLARQFQQTLYELIFLDQPYEEFIKQTVADVLDGCYDKELVLRRRLRRKLKDYVKNVPPHVQAARKAEVIRNERGLPNLYDQGGWIEYIMTINGPEPKQYRQSAIDVDFYVERQITPIVDSILVFKSTSMKELLDKQIGLF